MLINVGDSHQWTYMRNLGGGGGGRKKKLVMTNVVLVNDLENNLGLKF